MMPERTRDPDERADSPVISVTNLTKTYEHDEGEPVTAVDDVSFDIDGEQIVGLLGPNGAGKTTTVKMILGLIRPTSGTVEIDGTDVAEQRRARFNEMSGVLEGARNLYWRLTVHENLEFFTALNGVDPRGVHAENERMLEIIGIAEDADRQVNDLSRGMTQKAAIACTLARRTPVVFLDEPTLGLDLKTTYDFQKELRRMIDEENRTVVLSSHNMDIVQNICDRVLIMQDGELIVDDTIDELTDMFGANTYRIITDEAVPEQVLVDLDRQFELVDQDVNEDCSELELLLQEPDEIYDLMDILRAANVTPTSVSDLESDLEQVFLAATNNEQDNELVQPMGGEHA